MFWKLGTFAFQNGSGIETLLDKPPGEITLDKVLDEEDLLQEIKVHNARLLDYLRQEHILSTLLDYIILADQHEDEKKAFKYAFVACEILSCEVWSICETVFEHPGLLPKFWSFIEAPPPLNPLRASYFTKVNEKFLEKKTEEMIAFIQGIPGVLDKLLKHSDTSAIMDLLLKIISMEKTDVGSGIVDWLHDDGLLDRLLAQLKPDVDPDVQTTIADVVKAIIAISANSQDQGVIGPNSLSRALVSDSKIRQMVTNMVQETSNGTNASLTTGVSIVIELIRKNNSDYDLTPIMALAYNNAPPSSRDPIYLGTMLRIFAEEIVSFQRILASSNNIKMIKTAGYDEVESLGFERFRICELYAELLHCSNMQLLNDPHGEAVVKQRDLEREKLRELQRQEKLNTPALHAGRHSSVVSETTSISDRVGDTLSPPQVSRRHSRRGSSSDEAPYLPVERSDSIVDVLDSSKTTQEDELERLADIGPQDQPLMHDLPSTRDTTDTLMMSSFSEKPELETVPETTQLGAAEDGVDGDSVIVTSKELSVDENEDDDLETQRKLEGRSHASDIDTVSLSISTDSRQPSISYEPVVGDYLKVQFIEHRVVPTILELFFCFPWNNFLHNVVYDVVQQVLNGPMDRGYNRVLAIDVFSQGLICERIVEGQARSDEHVAEKGVRLGYMGHLTLIAEEVVKFAQRFPPREVSPLVEEKVQSAMWTAYVETTLAETRARDSAILGGVRPLGPAQQAQQGLAAQSTVDGVVDGGAWDTDPGAYDATGSFQYSFQSGGHGDDDEDEDDIDADDRELARRLGRFSMDREDDDGEDDLDDDDDELLDDELEEDVDPDDEEALERTRRRRQQLRQQRNFERRAAGAQQAGSAAADERDQFANYISQQIAGDVTGKFGSSDEDEESDEEDAAGRAHYWSAMSQPRRADFGRPGGPIGDPDELDEDEETFGEPVRENLTELHQIATTSAPNEFEIGHESRVESTDPIVAHAEASTDEDNKPASPAVRSRPILSLGDSSESSEDEDVAKHNVRSPPRQTASPAAERSSLDEDE
ncbi:sporulation-induced protein [Savitreella phatthalungensis]